MTRVASEFEKSGSTGFFGSIAEYRRVPNCPTITATSADAKIDFNIIVIQS